MIHTDGTPTIASGTQGHRLASVFGCKPEIVQDAIARDVQPPDECREMYHGAMRAFATIREAIQDGSCKTVADVLTLAAALELTYKALIR